MCWDWGGGSGGCLQQPGTDDHSNSSQAESVVEKKIRSCGDSKLVREICYCAAKDESIHSMDYKCTAIINDSAQSVLLSRLLNERLQCSHYEMIVQKGYCGIRD